jgi:hypothetical protein
MSICSRIPEPRLIAIRLNITRPSLIIGGMLDPWLSKKLRQTNQEQENEKAPDKQAKEENKPT